MDISHTHRFATTARRDARPRRLHGRTEQVDDGRDVALVALPDEGRAALEAAMLLEALEIETRTVLVPDLLPSSARELAELIAGVSVVVCAAEDDADALGTFVGETLAAWGLDCRLQREGPRATPEQLVAAAIAGLDALSAERARRGGRGGRGG